jgi:hypothetical protein
MEEEEPSYPVLNKLPLTWIFFITIDGGHAEALVTWGQCIGRGQETTLQSKYHYFLHDQ